MLKAAISIGCLCLVALVALIIGLKRGFAAMAQKPKYVVAAIFLAYFVMIALMSLIDNTEAHRSICKAFASITFTSQGYGVAVSSAEQLKSAMSGTFWGFLKFNADNIYGQMTVGGMTTFGVFMATAIITFLEKLLLWLLSFLTIKYVLKGLQLLLEKPSTGGLMFLDKTLGVLWTIGWAYFILVSLTYTLALMIVVLCFPQSGASAVAFIKSVPILNHLHATNGVGAYIGRLFNVDIIHMIKF